MKYLLSVPIILFPYTLLFALYCLYTGLFMESFANNGYLLLAAVVLCGATAFAFCVVFCALSLAKRWCASEMARWNMIVKLCQIPAYIAIFVLGACFLISIFGIPFVLLFTLCDIAAIIMSGLIGGVAAFAAFSEKKLSRSDAIVYAFCQFLFCVDIVFCILLYIRIKRSEKLTRERKDEPDTQRI